MPWRLLVDLGVDGFEIVSDTDRASGDLIRQWKEAGMRLFSGTDFHGWRKSIYGWNLVGRDIINPDGKELHELDPREVLRRIFHSGDIQVVTTTRAPSGSSFLLRAPMATWMYFRSLSPASRLSWAAFAVSLWVVRVALGRRRRPASEGIA